MALFKDIREEEEEDLEEFKSITIKASAIDELTRKDRDRDRDRDKDRDNGRDKEAPSARDSGKDRDSARESNKGDKEPKKPPRSIRKSASDLSTASSSSSSVGVWLEMFGLRQYESVFMAGGFDTVELVSLCVLCASQNNR